MNIYHLIAKNGKPVKVLAKSLSQAKFIASLIR